MGDHPFYRFFRRVSFPLDHKLWRKMPRHPSFKHEYWDGKLHWTPRPNTCDVYLDLAHLDWIFVAWMEQRRGIGTLLLGAVVSELRALGHSTLASTVLTGNAAPMLWHWRSGFHLPRDG